MFPAPRRFGSDRHASRDTLSWRRVRGVRNFTPHCGSRLSYSTRFKPRAVRWDAPCRISRYDRGEPYVPSSRRLRALLDRRPRTRRGVIGDSSALGSAAQRAREGRRKRSRNAESTGCRFGLRWRGIASACPHAAVLWARRPNGGTWVCNKQQRGVSQRGGGTERGGVRSGALAAEETRSCGSRFRKFWGPAHPVIPFSHNTVFSTRFHDVSPALRWPRTPAVVPTSSSFVSRTAGTTVQSGATHSCGGPGALSRCGDVACQFYRAAVGHSTQLLLPNPDAWCTQLEAAKLKNG